MHYDADDIDIAESGGEKVKTVHTVTVLRQIEGPSFVTAQAIPGAGTESTIAIAAPFQQSTPPMSGTFQIVCNNADGTEFKTREFAHTHWS